MASEFQGNQNGNSGAGRLQLLAIGSTFCLRPIVPVPADKVFKPAASPVRKLAGLIRD